MRRNEQGVAAIFVVLTLMTLLALISIGFSRLMNREVRQSLDRQLSTAAYYAAESGVNDARAYLLDNPGAPKIDGCATPAAASDFFVNNGDISGDGLFKYSCVTVNPTPNVLTFNIPAGQSKVVKLSGASLSTLKRFYISWQNSSPYGGPPKPLGTLGTMPQTNNVPTDATGAIRLGVYPVMDGSGSCSGSASLLTPALTDTTDIGIECASRGYFLYPSLNTGGSNSVNFQDPALNAKTVTGNCTTPAVVPPTTYSAQATAMYCNSVIDNLYSVTPSSSASNPSSYFLRLTALYKDVNVQIQATDGGSPDKSLTISSAQGVVDITATGNDVLRRIQAHVPLQNAYPQTYGVQSMESICKLFRNPVTSSTQYGEAEYDSLVGSVGTDNACTKPAGTNQIANDGLPGIDITPPTVTFYADDTNLTDGQRTNLHWSTSSSTVSCDAGGSWSGPKPLNGFQDTGSLSTGTYTYTLMCQNTVGDSQTRTVTINVTNPPPPPPPPPPTTCNITGISPYNGGGANASGGCTDGSANWSWTVNYNGGACGSYSYSGGGPSATGTAKGSYSVTFTLTGNTGGFAQGSSGWSSSSRFC